MKRMNCYFLLLAASLCVLPLHAQKEYPIDRITAINLGDGRILHREISGDKPLDGEHRIIDGYHSAYILARFKDGLYNGDYEEYIYNKLKAKGSYKEGWKDGIFRKYNPQNEMFRRFRTKCSIFQNETYLRESFFLPINQIKKHRKNLLLRCFFIACLNEGGGIPSQCHCKAVITAFYYAAEFVHGPSLRLYNIMSVYPAL